jgi:hypothetical protein
MAMMPDLMEFHIWRKSQTNTEFLEMPEIFSVMYSRGKEYKFTDKQTYEAWIACFETTAIEEHVECFAKAVSENKPVKYGPDVLETVACVVYRYHDFPPKLQTLMVWPVRKIDSLSTTNEYIEKQLKRLSEKYGIPYEELAKKWDNSPENHNWPAMGEVIRKIRGMRLDATTPMEIMDPTPPIEGKLPIILQIPIEVDQKQEIEKVLIIRNVVIKITDESELVRRIREAEITAIKERLATLLSSYSAITIRLGNKSAARDGKCLTTIILAELKDGQLLVEKEIEVYPPRHTCARGSSQVVYDCVKSVEDLLTVPVQRILKIWDEKSISFEREAPPYDYHKNSDAIEGDEPEADRSDSRFNTVYQLVKKTEQYLKKNQEKVKELQEMGRQVIEAKILGYSLSFYRGETHGTLIPGTERIKAGTLTHIIVAKLSSPLEKGRYMMCPLTRKRVGKVEELSDRDGDTYVTVTVSLNLETLLEPWESVSKDLLPLITENFIEPEKLPTYTSKGTGDPEQRFTDLVKKELDVNSSYTEYLDSPLNWEEFELDKILAYDGEEDPLKGTTWIIVHRNRLVVITSKEWLGRRLLQLEGMALEEHLAEFINHFDRQTVWSPPQKHEILKRVTIAEFNQGKLVGFHVEPIWPPKGIDIRFASNNRIVGEFLRYGTLQTGKPLRLLAKFWDTRPDVRITKREVIRTSPLIQTKYSSGNPNAKATIAAEELCALDGRVIEPPSNWAAVSLKDIYKDHEVLPEEVTLIVANNWASPVYTEEQEAKCIQNLEEASLRDHLDYFGTAFRPTLGDPIRGEACKPCEPLKEVEIVKFEIGCFASKTTRLVWPAASIQTRSNGQNRIVHKKLQEISEQYKVPYKRIAELWDNIPNYHYKETEESQSSKVMKVSMINASGLSSGVESYPYGHPLHRYADPTRLSTYDFRDGYTRSLTIGEKTVIVYGDADMQERLRLAEQQTLVDYLSDFVWRQEHQKIQRLEIARQNRVPINMATLTVSYRMGPLETYIIPLWPPLRIDLTTSKEVETWIAVASEITGKQTDELLREWNTYMAGFYRGLFPTPGYMLPLPEVHLESNIEALRRGSKIRPTVPETEDQYEGGISVRDANTYISTNISQYVGKSFGILYFNGNKYVAKDEVELRDIIIMLETEEVRAKLTKLARAVITSIESNLTFWAQPQCHIGRNRIKEIE